MTSEAGVPSSCPKCGGALVAATVRTTFWRDDRPVIVEGIPAHVCHSCIDQFYDEDVSDALRRLAEEGFPAAEASREIAVPVFTLAGRIRVRGTLPEDSHID